MGERFRYALICLIAYLEVDIALVIRAADGEGVT
jgi:hypothetical protein